MICRSPILEEECPHCASWGSLPEVVEKQKQSLGVGVGRLFLRNDLKQ